MKNVKFIAEVSSNHSQDLNRCLQFVDKSAEIGCDAVKFQLFKIHELFSEEAFKNKPNLLERKKWELPLSFIPEIAKRCRANNIEFSCTPFYLDAVSELEPYINFYKIASYELLWDDLLIRCARTKKPILLSTGMATIKEIKHAVDIIKKNKCTDLTLLHCTSAYPTPFADANLSAIKSIQEETNCEVGWSDHTVEPAVIARAIHKWDAKVIEFHLDLEGRGEEFDSGHCWLPDQIALVIDQVKKSFLADGSNVKGPTNLELSERMWRADPVDGLRPLKSIRNKL
jgi:sialic acid synthase SpsE